MTSLGILFSLGLVSIIGIMTAWLLMVTCFRRKLYALSEHYPEHGRTFLGKPLLFPTRLSHTRMSRERYSYWHSYFNVGIPVGLRGRVGTVLSIDMNRTDAHVSGKGTSCSPVRRPFMCWFNIDPAYYLERGNNHLGLEGKLHAFLRSIASYHPTYIRHGLMLTVLGRGSEAVALRLSSRDSPVLVVDEESNFLLVFVFPVQGT